MAIRPTTHPRRNQRIVLLAALVAAIIAGIFLTFGSHMAKADGYLPSQPGYESSKDEATVYQHRPTTYIKRARYDREDSLRRYVSREEMRELERIKRRAEKRRLAAEKRRYADAPVRRRPVAAYVEDEPRRERYVEARTVRYEDDEDDRPSRKCVSAVKATSKPMLTEARALKEAKRNWSMLVTEDYSGAYNDVRNAKVIRSHCKPLHEGAWRTECTFVARPCREL